MCRINGTLACAIELCCRTLRRTMHFMYALLLATAYSLPRALPQRTFSHVWIRPVSIQVCILKLTLLMSDSFLTRGWSIAHASVCSHTRRSSSYSHPLSSNLLQYVTSCVVKLVECMTFQTSGSLVTPGEDYTEDGTDVANRGIAAVGLYDRGTCYSLSVY